MWTRGCAEGLTLTTGTLVVHARLSLNLTAVTLDQARDIAEISPRYRRDVSAATLDQILNRRRKLVDDMAQSLQVS